MKSPSRLAPEKPVKPPTSIPKGFFQVNMSQHDESELRDLANAFGIDLRLFISGAIRDRAVEFKSMLAKAKQKAISPSAFLASHAGQNTGVVNSEVRDRELPDARCLQCVRGIN